VVAVVVAEEEVDVVLALRLERPARQLPPTKAKTTTTLAPTTTLTVRTRPPLDAVIEEEAKVVKTLELKEMLVLLHLLEEEVAEVHEVVGDEVDVSPEPHERPTIAHLLRPLSLSPIFPSLWTIMACKNFSKPKTQRKPMLF
jgi:hypothetical protein